MRVVQWFSGLPCRLTHSVGLNLGPVEFTRTVFVRVKPSHSPEKYRPGAVWYCVSVQSLFIHVSSIINCQPVVSISPPAARCFRLHKAVTLNTSKKKEEKQYSEKNSHLFVTALSCVQGSDVSASDLWGCLTYCPFIYLFIFQTWRTSRLTEEALYQSVKVKEWFCCAAPHHILEVKQHILIFNDCFPVGKHTPRIRG